MARSAETTARSTGDPIRPHAPLRQRPDFRSGNEAAALAARDIGFHLMGYFPITPSTEVAENLARMQAEGEHDIALVPGDGEHGAAGICYGAALGGGRVLNVTSSQGLLYALEQLPVQAGTRVPMVLNVACRTVSGPLDIRGDHSDLYYVLNTGWIILLARDPQAVYDLNFAAVRIGEHMDVRLPVLVAYDGFFTSHQKRRIQAFDDAAAIRRFLGECQSPYTALDPEHPLTFGPYMNDPDLINNKMQLSLAMDAARTVVPEVLSELRSLTGRDYPVLDAYRMEGARAALALEAADRGAVEVPFAYHGTYAGEPGRNPRPGLPAIATEEVSRATAKVTPDADSGRLHVELEPLWKMTAVPPRVAPGHGGCPGCGIFPVLHQAYSVLEGDLVVLFQTGCAMVVTTGYPATAHRITYIHNLFQNGAATLSGLVEMYRERMRRGELPGSPDITFMMVTGDGGMDIGMGPAIGAANRSHNMIILEYDNQGYMNTGAQLSYATPMGHRTSTSEVGSQRPGKVFHHKDTAQIFAACHLPYVFTASEGYPEDLMRKVAKAQWYAKREGLVYGKVLSFCPLNWRTEDDQAAEVLQVAVDSCFFPLYEVEKGHTEITYDPDAVGRRRQMTDWLGLMGKTRHLLSEANAERVDAIQTEVERRWRRLKSMHEHPEL